MDKEKLNMFIRLLKQAPVMRKTFDLGLIIKEPKSKTEIEEVFSQVKKLVKVEKIIYSQSAIDEDIFEKIIDVFKNKKWVFLEIKKDLTSPFLNQLKHLSNYNSLQLVDYKRKDLFEMKIPKDCRLIVYGEREFIENKISYPYFYRLFGPTLNV